MLYRPLRWALRSWRWHSDKCLSTEAFPCPWKSLDKALWDNDRGTILFPVRLPPHPSWFIHLHTQACVQQTFFLWQVCGRAGTGDMVCAFQVCNPMWTKNQTRASTLRLGQALLGTQTMAMSNGLVSQTSDTLLVGAYKWIQPSRKQFGHTHQESSTVHTLCILLVNIYFRE